MRGECLVQGVKHGELCGSTPGGIVTGSVRRRNVDISLLLFDLKKAWHVRIPCTRHCQLYMRRSMENEISDMLTLQATEYDAVQHSAAHRHLRRDAQTVVLLTRIGNRNKQSVICPA